MIATRENVLDGWLKCPHCGKKIFPISDNTDVRHLEMMCKSCKRKMQISIRPAAT